jgi:hypothetical protein
LTTEYVAVHRSSSSFSHSPIHPLSHSVFPPPLQLTPTILMLLPAARAAAAPVAITESAAAAPKNVHRVKSVAIAISFR